ncbi:MAG TPA: ABC transporter permease subunit [Acidimicrobiia bacterium]|nr:ABC transporter permease subunit [Acidimicrobiia bacterium]
MVEEVRSHTPLWRDVRVLRLVAQVAAAAIVAFIAYVLWFNLTNNLRAAGLPTGFDFLTQPLGVDIPGADLSSGAPIWRGLLVGIKNTLALVVVGIPLLTIIGVMVGVARLSTNWLVAKAAGLYVEILRNIPPLLIIYFVFNAVVLQFPLLQESLNLGDFLIVNNRYIAVVGFTSEPDFGPFLLIMAGALVIAAGVWWWRTRRSERTGVHHHRFLWSLAVFSVISIVGFLVLGGPFGLSRPVLDGRALEGGYQGLAAYWAVLAALVLYTASHVAEIVRGSILAVPKGQSEAANAIALTPFQRLRYVVMPQALRIAIPPIISQYLNYTKNTSLAIAIGYAEVTRLTFQMIGNGQPAPQMIAILMGIYLGFSLVISLIVNVVNRRMQLVTR